MQRLARTMRKLTLVLCADFRKTKALDKLQFVKRVCLSLLNDLTQIKEKDVSWFLD